MAILACRFTLGRLRTREWPIVGVRADWLRDDWPIPLLCRYDELREQHVVVRYDEDVFEPTAVLPLHPGDSAERYPSDDFFGDGVLPIKLARLLNANVRTDP